MNNWISVNERLPDKTGKVLVYAPDTGKYPQKEILGEAYFLNKSNVFLIGDAYTTTLIGVTHWQPLPPPPEDD